MQAYPHSSSACQLQAPRSRHHKLTAHSLPTILQLPLTVQLQQHSQPQQQQQQALVWPDTPQPSFSAPPPPCRPSHRLDQEPLGAHRAHNKAFVKSLRHVDSMLQLEECLLQGASAAHDLDSQSICAVGSCLVRLAHSGTSMPTQPVPDRSGPGRPGQQGRLGSLGAAPVFELQAGSTAEPLHRLQAFAMRVWVPQLMARLPVMDGPGLAMCTHTAATLQLRSPRLLEALLQACEPHLHRSTPRVQSMLLSSLSHVGLVPAQSWLSTWFSASIRKLAHYEQQDLCMVTWAVTKLSLRVPQRWISAVMHAWYKQLELQLRQNTSWSSCSPACAPSNSPSLASTAPPLPPPASRTVPPSPASAGPPHYHPTTPASAASPASQGPYHPTIPLPPASTASQSPPYPPTSPSCPAFPASDGPPYPHNIPAPPAAQLHGLAVMSWALARLRVRPAPELLDACTLVAQQAILASRPAALRPGTLAMLAYSLAMFKHRPSPSFLAAFLPATVACMHSAKPQDFVLLALAVSNWGPQPLTPEWLPQLLRHSQPTLAYQSPQGLVLLLDSLAQLECRPHVGWMQQLEACLAPHLPTFHPKVAAQMMACFAAIGYRPASGLLHALWARAASAAPYMAAKRWFPALLSAALLGCPPFPALIANPLPGNATCQHLPAAHLTAPPSAHVAVTAARGDAHLPPAGPTGQAALQGTAGPDFLQNWHPSSLLSPLAVAQQGKPAPTPSLHSLALQPPPPRSAAGTHSPSQRAHPTGAAEPGVLQVQLAPLLAASGEKYAHCSAINLAHMAWALVLWVQASSEAPAPTPYPPPTFGLTPASFLAPVAISSVVSWSQGQGVAWSQVRSEPWAVRWLHSLMAALRQRLPTASAAELAALLGALAQLGPLLLPPLPLPVAPLPQQPLGHTAGVFGPESQQLQHQAATGAGTGAGMASGAQAMGGAGGGEGSGAGAAAEPLGALAVWEHVQLLLATVSTRVHLFSLEQLVTVLQAAHTLGACCVAPAAQPVSPGCPPGALTLLTICKQCVKLLLEAHRTRTAHQEGMPTEQGSATQQPGSTSGVPGQRGSTAEGLGQGGSAAEGPAEQPENGLRQRLLSLAAARMQRTDPGAASEACGMKAWHALQAVGYMHSQGSPQSQSELLIYTACCSYSA